MKKRVRVKNLSVGKFSVKRLRALSLGALLLFVMTLAGCASSHLTAPCPQFGAYCSKLSINRWHDAAARSLT